MPNRLSLLPLTTSDFLGSKSKDPMARCVVPNGIIIRFGGALDSIRAARLTTRLEVQAEGQSADWPVPRSDVLQIHSGCYLRYYDGIASILTANEAVC